MQKLINYRFNDRKLLLFRRNPRKKNVMTQKSINYRYFGEEKIIIDI